MATRKVMLSEFPWDERYRISDIGDVLTPALVMYPEIIASNIERTLHLLGGKLPSPDEVTHLPYWSNFTLEYLAKVGVTPRPVFLCSRNDLSASLDLHAPQARPMGLPSVTQGALCCKFRKIHFDPSNHVEVTRKARREAMVSLTPSPEAGITYTSVGNAGLIPTAKESPNALLWRRRIQRDLVIADAVLDSYIAQQFI